MLDITDEEWRAAGYTPAACRYPLSTDAIRVLCYMNRIKLDQAPRAWHFAPNEALQRQLEALTSSPIMAFAREYT